MVADVTPVKIIIRAQLKHKLYSRVENFIPYLWSRKLVEEGAQKFNQIRGFDIASSLVVYVSSCYNGILENSLVLI